MPHETPDRRVEQSLTAAVGLDRTASADDDLPVAATVVLLRDSTEGVQVLMMERPDRGSFAGAWVFPGGKLEPGDRLEEVDSEETVARRAGVRETAEETGLTVDPTGLTTLSCWNPPPGIALRIRTWFFVVSADEAVASDATLYLSPYEAVAAEWVHPADALARHGRGEFTLYPPTWVTLFGLADHPDVGSAIAAARLGGIQRFETVARRGADGPLLLWQGDAEYDPDAAAAASGSSARSASASRSSADPHGAARHRLEIGALPWTYTRTG